MKSWVLCSLVLFSFSGRVVAQSDFELVRQRVVDEILDSRISDDRVTGIVETIGEDGSWPGIDYVDVSNTGFEHTVHLRNMVTMSLAFHTEESEYYHSQEVSKLISRSLGFWCENDFICENWWYNQIGTPQALVTVLLLIDEQIDDDLKDKTLDIIGRANLEATGARPGGDRIKIGGIEAKKVLATGDTAQFARIMRVINDEIRFNTGDRGMQHDYSFHHRVDRVNNTVSYGLGYAEAFAEWAVYVKGTSYAFSDKRIRQLVDYYLDGICKQYVYGMYTDPGVLNRDVSRGGSFRPHSTFLPEALLQVTGYRSGELEEIIRLRRGESEPSASFCKFFWQTEHLVFQRPGYYTSVRMFSIRNRNMEEPYNSEGLKNHHKADGANFLSVRGDEYINIWPVYDWQKIPGTTALQKASLPPAREIQKDGLTTFVGAVTDGQYGAIGFDFISPHDLIKARKSWFFFDHEYVCLGAGIESTSGSPVATTLNQCLLRGEVVINESNGDRILDHGEYVLDHVKWIHHDGTGYIFPEETTVHLTSREEWGSWWDITKQWNTSREQVTEQVFKLWIDHGARPQGRRGGLVNEPMIAKDITYQYIVVPSVELEEMKQNPGIEIIANNRWIQGVKHGELDMAQLIFYRAGSVQISDKRTLTIDSPGAILLKMEGERIMEITIADPSRLLDRIHLTISGQIESRGSEHFHVDYDPAKQLTKLTFELPTGYYTGQSIHVKLQQESTGESNN